MILLATCTEPRVMQYLNGIWRIDLPSYLRSLARLGDTWKLAVVSNNTLRFVKFRKSRTFILRTRDITQLVSSLRIIEGDGGCQFILLHKGQHV